MSGKHQNVRKTSECQENIRISEKGIEIPKMPKKSLNLKNKY